MPCSSSCILDDIVVIIVTTSEQCTAWFERTGVVVIVKHWLLTKAILVIIQDRWHHNPPYDPCDLP
jgi:hypothetical protein